MKVLICGGRNYHQGERVDAVLDEIHGRTPITCVITGAAPGADLCGEDWARSRQIPYRGYPASWKLHGRAAGPIRNAYMLDIEHRPSAGKPVRLFSEKT